VALWALTKAEVVNGIEVILRRLSGRETPTYYEKRVIENAFNTAIVDICLDAGVSRWRFIQADETVDLTGGTRYADLDADIFNVISDTVRITSEDVNLYPNTLEFIYSTDPDGDEEGLPRWYALDSSTDPETIRMVFKPIPDAAYTVSFVAETIPDEDSISSLPSWMHGLLKDKATENALRDLGYANASIPFNLSYRQRKQDNKASQGMDTPQHIRRVTNVRPSQGIESRIP